MTTEEQAWEQGYEAYTKGRSETSNPFDPQDNLHLSWNDGYEAAANDDEEGK